jgi:glycosyltransferase involved in cell wall biosynthesis
MEQEISADVVRIEHQARLGTRVPLLGNWSVEASLATRKALRRCLLAGRRDAIFIHTQVASLLSVGMMQAIPTVVSMDATPINYDRIADGYRHKRQPAAVEGLKRQINQRALAASAAIVAFSRWAADSLVADYGIRPEKVHVIRPGVDLGRWHPARSLRVAGPPRILFVGGDFVRKGGQDLLEAMREVADSAAELDIVTTSPPATLPQGPNVRVHVGLDHDSPNLFELYRRADLFVLPSRAECYGHVFCEAMASGVPVVGCDVGAVPELVVDGHNGMLVPPGSPGALAQALRTLIDDPDLRHRLGERGLAMARADHDADRNARAVFQLMAEVSGRQCARTPAT